VFVDLLRFVAALQMLQGHTIAALLAHAHRSGPVYQLWSQARGLTSVAFLFAAGVSFQLATESEARAADPLAARRRRRRALRLIGLGYLLHLPLAAAFTTDPAVRAAALREFMAVDVLQCIGVCVLALEGLRRAVPKARARTAISVALGVGCLAVAPLAWMWPGDGPLAPLLAYLTPRTGSIFPLVPWAAHLFFGFAVGALVRAPGRLGTTGRLLALTTLAALASALCAHWVESRVVLGHVSRLAWVLGVSSALSALGDRLARVPPRIAQLAGHTLLLYVFHVLLVYGQGVGLASWIGPRLSPLAAAAAAALVVLASCGVALYWDRLARARRTG